MAVNLTEQEQLQVDKKSKNSNELPTYYDATTRSNVAISRDFEAFLILATTELKTSALSWIKKATSLQKTNKKRDDLVTLALTQEMNNAQKIISSLDSTLQDFNTFRTNFQFKDASNFSTVPEIQKFLFDLQKVVEELAVARDRAFFDDVVSQVTGRNNDSLNLSDAQVEELQSWQEVLSAYLQA